MPDNKIFRNMKTNTNTPENKAPAEVYTPKFDLTAKAEKSLAAQVVDFLMPDNAARLAKSAYVLLNSVGEKSADAQAEFVGSCRLEYVTGINQTDDTSCIRALVSASLLSVGRGQPMTASDKVEAAKDLLGELTHADW